MATDDEFPASEIARRMERNIRRFMKTPPMPHGKNPAARPGQIVLREEPVLVTKRLRKPKAPSR